MTDSPLIDTGGIAKLLGVSRAHVTDRLTKAPTFPAPVIDLSQRMRRWDRAQVLAWLAGSTRGYKPKLDAASGPGDA